ncbi:SpoIIE family protein phosphatase [Alloacidobacterium dinghuense]|uniref:SpoIIE family protein phosphatase n=1 Tax=Alloacidobacterium dinghuense TaxID=2763107 RepID=A0A7G8BE93_9BACT|nr:SpoIIE family protein phosphatase [Alloacidobacterium dinghuense]QNI30863.1 SpoIIE family protein phosphatase [Alloacidobacterium dinghuense]
MLPSEIKLMTLGLQIDAGLEAQLELARQVQLSLLPERGCCLGGWEVAFSYEPAGLLSGDYVDLIPAGPDAFYFALGDVSGKGIAASMLMSHLHATLRTLLPLKASIEAVVKTASHTFCQSALPAQFATLVIGKAERNGMVELVNAGHTPILLADANEVQVIVAANLPVGMFCSTDFTAVKRIVSPRSTLVLYSDGITESTDKSGNEYDLSRLSETLFQSRHLSPREILDTISASIADFSSSAPASDDRTMLALQRL